MRAFVALTVPENYCKELWDLGKRMSHPDVRVSWVRPNRMHLTLRFLGDIDDLQCESLCGALRDAYRGQAAFELTLAGIGAFPNLQRPSVVWAGISPLGGPLAQTQHVAEVAAQAVGIAPDRKPYAPHLTIGRIRDESNGALLTPALIAEKAFACGAFTVSSVSLWKSDLRAVAPQYSLLEEFPF